ncbi:hypothetical protein Ga0100231_017350 [Opitutaceae bacterium TAV4]|nr:hypothetical protein Ga0100231_017350 [Opitutaceae bacterium TAV4]RRJ99228.1 hypothetical protein Ga0100230_013510 [Opitutaceae bacterium TAV3]
MKTTQCIRWIIPFFLILTASAWAQTPPAGATKKAGSVEVINVRFNKQNPGASSSISGQWLEAEIELNVKSPGSGVERFVNHVRVTLNLGLEVTSPPKGSPPIQLYRASVEMVALETGRNFVRFYLPPEVVKRDTISASVKYYLVTLAVGGEEVSTEQAGRAAVSNGLPKVESFMAEISSKAGANDGILQPQHLTPFFNDSNKKAPTAVRREQL